MCMGLRTILPLQNEDALKLFRLCTLMISAKVNLSNVQGPNDLE